MNTTRRSLMLSGAAVLCAAPTHRLVAAALSPAPARKLKVVVAGGHPGDPEYGCGGTIAALTQHGHEVALLYLNDGAWPPTSREVRMAEAKRACDLLGARPIYAGQENGHAVIDNAHYEQFSKLLYAEAPDAVFTQWPLDNHRDHRAVSTLAYDAWVKAHKRFALYYYEVSDGEDTMQFSPDKYVDIAEIETRKRSACFAHASQTPERYYHLQDQVALFRGIENGCQRAEAFVLQSQSPLDILAAPRVF